MNKEALGVIETVGMAAAIQAADTCVKSANVELIGYELTKGSGLVTIKIRGNVGAVKAAIEAAKVSAARINQVYATLIIPRPAEKLEGLIESDSTVGIRAKKEDKDKVEDTVNVEEESRDKVEDSANVEEESKEKVEDIVNVEEESKDKVEGSANVEEESKDKLEDSAAEETNEDVQRVDQDLEDSKVLEINNKNDDNFEEEDKTLVSNDFVLENPLETEGFEEKKPSSENDEEIEEFQQDDSSLDEQESDEICNICHDPTCTRKKGQPKTLCINYKATRR